MKTNDLLDHLRVTILVTDRVGTILEAHGGNGLPLGYRPEELVGRSGLEFIAPEDHQVMADMYSSSDDLPMVSKAESFSLRIINPDGEVQTWDCLPTGISSSPVDGWVTTMTCRSEQNTATTAMYCLMEGGSSKDVAALVARQHTIEVEEKWRKCSFALYKVASNETADVDRWELLPPSDGADARLATAIEATKEDPCAPWNTMNPGSTRVVEDIPLALAAVAHEVGLQHCMVFCVGLEDETFVAFVRFFNYPQVASGNNFLADRAIERVLLQALSSESAYERLRVAARVDPLTGISNRLRFDEEINEIADTTGLAVLYIDVDNFKAVNDTYGHAVGDNVLSEIAIRVERVFRPSDVVARIGGDEFAVILRGVTSEIAHSVAERLKSAIAEPFDVAGPKHVSITVGISTGGDRTLAEMVQAADQEMLMLKRKHVS